MIQSMIYGADVDVADYEDAKALLITDPSGWQFVIPLTAGQALKVRTALSDLELPPLAEAS